MMSLFVSSLLLPFLLLSIVSCNDTIFENYTSLSFDEGYTQLFGDDNLMLLRDGKTVHLSLDERSGSGFASQDLYLHGYFSASIKLPSDYAAGVVVAFYVINDPCGSRSKGHENLQLCMLVLMSNGDVFEKTHDELDFEFLGNVRGREWRVQTNIYGNGSTGVGREERYSLWFDPTEDFHRYSILWSNKRIIFYIDDIPIREMVRTPSMGGDFPSKPMSLYATIWDGSTWATLGGRYKVNYKYAPFVVELADLVLHGCSVDPMDHLTTCNEHESDRYGSITISEDQRVAMENLREKYVTYSYCHDRERYPTPTSECSIGVGEAKVYRSSGERLADRHRRGRRHRRGSSGRVSL